MKRIKYFVLVALFLIPFSRSYSQCQVYSEMEESKGPSPQYEKSWGTNDGSKKKIKKNGQTYVEFIDESDMKEYNPDARWQQEDCKHCGGTGFTVKSWYDAKRNRMIKNMEVCIYCKGKGKSGSMSKK